jgi:hypothetical protein
MTAAPIPSYPVIYVDVRADGSAHLNVAGRHIYYPAGPLADTRAAVTRYAVDMALTLGRPVRINTTDPAGTFRMAAHPNGTLTDLAPAEASTPTPARPSTRGRAADRRHSGHSAASGTGAAGACGRPRAGRRPACRTRGNAALTPPRSGVDV